MYNRNTFESDVGKFMKVEKDLKYREALELWLKEHLGKTVNDVPSNEVVVLESGELVNLGKRLSNIKQILKGKIKGNFS